jgi:hypothetical protein
MIAVRQFIPWSIGGTLVFCALVLPANGGEAFPEHIQNALARYDDAARLIVEARYESAFAALEGLGKSLAEPYSAKAASAARKLQETVVRPRFDDRSSYLRGRRRILAAEVCLELHAYREAAEILDEVVRDSVLAIQNDKKIEVVRRAYRYAGSDAARYRELFERCRAVDDDIYPRRLYDGDYQSAARRRDDDLEKRLDESPSELTALGLEEFHWLRLRRLCRAWPGLNDPSVRAEALLKESATQIGDDTLAAAQGPSPEPIDRATADRETAAKIETLLAEGRVDAAAALCREFIPKARDLDVCVTAVFAAAARLTETERYDAALELARQLVLAHQFGSRTDFKHQAAVAAYHTCVRQGNPKQALEWAEMAVGPFCLRSGCGNCQAAIERANDYLIAEARLRADPSDAAIDAGFDVLVTYGKFEGSIGPLIAWECARRGSLDALERRIERLADPATEGNRRKVSGLLIECPPVAAEVIPGIRMQIELQRIRTADDWDGLWTRLIAGGRRVHQAFGLATGSRSILKGGKIQDNRLDDKVARQTVALLLDRPDETPTKLRQVRNIDDVKLGWSLYLSAALGREGAPQAIRARFDSIAATLNPDLLENYLDCLTAMAALPEKERTALADEIRSARYQLEKKLAADPEFRPAFLNDVKSVRRPRFLEE